MSPTQQTLKINKEELFDNIERDNEVKNRKRKSITEKRESGLREKSESSCGLQFQRQTKQENKCKHESSCDSKVSNDTETKVTRADGGCLGFCRRRRTW